MPSADQVPVKSSHSTMLWPMWVVPMPDRPALHYVLFALPTFTSRRMADAISFMPQARQVPCSAHPGPSWPTPFWRLVGERDGGDLRRPPRQQRREPRTVLGAMDFGITDDRKCASCEQAAQIAIALFADAAKLVLASARVLFGDESDPGRE